MRPMGIEAYKSLSSPFANGHSAANISRIDIVYGDDEFAVLHLTIDNGGEMPCSLACMCFI